MKKANANDARYVKSTKKLYRALTKLLRQRRSGVRTIEICEAAAITRPTFYSHHTGVDAAFRDCEDTIRTEFIKRIPKDCHKNDVIYTILLSFMYDNRNYFKSTILNSNYWLLDAMLNDARKSLVGEKVSDRAYHFYVQRQMAIIDDWVKFEHCSKDQIQEYVTKLVRTRVIDPRNVTSG